MNKKLFFILPLLIGFALAPVTSSATDGIRPVQLRCEFRDQPAGVDTAQPRLSWVLKVDDESAATRGQKQTAYQVLVEAAPGDPLWDSGKTVSDESLHIRYAGRQLRSSQLVSWRVRVWDKDDKPSAWSQPTTWTMGLLRASDWQAQWIGAETNMPPVRTARGYHATEATRPDTVTWVQVDLGQAQPLSAIRLVPMLHEDKVGFGFPVRFKIEASAGPEFKEATLLVDKTAVDCPNPGSAPLAFDVQGSTARYVRVTATKLGQFTARYCFALSQLEVIAHGRNVALGAPVTALDSVEQWGWAKAALTDGAPGAEASGQGTGASALLRRTFAVKPGLRHAVAHVCGLGAYELSLNGAQVGADLFSPGWTKYNKTCLYDTHDITASLHPGQNEVRLLLGHGMYDVTGGRYTKFKGTFGPLKAIAQLRLEYADGTAEIVGTDARWDVSPGPLTFSCVYGGEDYDARWQPQWEPAKVVAGPGGALTGLSCAAPPIRAFDVLKPVQVHGTVYDLGQNAALMPRITVHGPAGSTVKIIPSELLKPDGTLDDTMCGGRSYWTYTLDGKGAQTWFPKFFYRGARYVQVECTGGAEVQTVEGVVVHSSAPPTGTFACSDDLFNRAHTLVRWAQRSNLMSVITDCPHREKLGWLEQYHLNGPALRYEFDLATLFAKGMNDMADAQLASGLVPSIAPEYVQFGGSRRNAFGDSPEWGSAFVLVAWQQYEFTGDVELLRRHYEAMKHYVAYLDSKAQEHIIDYGLGDWYDLGPKPPGVAQLTPKALTATAIYFEDVSTLAKVAKVLGRDSDTSHYEAQAGRIRTAFNAKFFNPQAGRYATGSQTANAMPLVVGLVEPAQRPAVVAALVQDVRDHGLTAGDVGYRYLLRALADNGRSDVVFEMNNQSDKPGYGYQLKKGATSLTEAWDAGRGSSQNHFMLGQINEWFYHDLAGIQPGAPGFKHILLKPAVVDGLAWVKARYDSPHGPIVSEWQHDRDTLRWAVAIPANTTATVFVPAHDLASVTESGHPAATAPGVKCLWMENGAAVFVITSGRYQFASTRVP